MGQSLSTQARSATSERRQRRILGWHRKKRRHEHEDPDALREEGTQSLLGSRPTLRLRSATRPRESSRFGAPTTVFQRQVSARSSSAQRPSEPIEEPASAQDAVVYEHEERPLMSVEDIRIGDAPISNITALPMPRSPSVIERLSSRLSQRYSSIEPGTLENEGNGSSWQLSPPASAQDDWQSDGSIHARSGRSMLGTLADPLPSSSTLRLRRRSAALGREPILNDSPVYGPLGTLQPSTNDTPASSENLTSQSSTRLSRVRRSLTGPLEALLNRPSNARPDRNTVPPSTPLPSIPLEQTTSEDTEYLLPPINISTALDLEDRSNPSTENPGRASTPIPESTIRSSWSDRWSPRTPTIRREPRRVPNLLRRSSNRRVRREDEMPLSRILQLAAATIAAQLSGNTDALANLEAVGDDHFDGGLTNFMDDLSSAAGSNPNANEGSSTDANNSPPPLNFWRAFRFMGGSSTLNTNDSRDESEQRTVTLVVVGVRSVLSPNLQREVSEGQEANIDTLLNDTPSPALSNNSRTRRPRSFLRNVSQRSSLGAYSRRSSLSIHDPFPSQHESQRHSLASSHRLPLEQQNAATNMTVERGMDSPQRVHLQPSASAEIPHPTLHSSSSPRTSRPLSTASDLNTPRETLMSENSSQAGDSTTGVNASGEPNPPVVHSYGDQPIDRETIPEPPPVRPRRRSDSELARAENLASHRNGTIDPDGGPLMGRSWLIYVVGTNLPADHPIFQVPSLLSDNPTYEDMVTLSNLLGPVRPPVAHPDDVERAGGLFKLVDAGAESDADQGLVSPALRAVPMEGTPGTPFTLAATDNCLVCLGGFAAAEELRELAKCKHRFHRACIDEWLTTGRNSCPLCRAAGVPRDETSSSAPMTSAPPG